MEHGIDGSMLGDCRGTQKWAMMHFWVFGKRWFFGGFRCSKLSKRDGICIFHNDIHIDVFSKSDSRSRIL